MNERPTPITDKNTYRKEQANCPTKVVPALICRRLERERDEAREQIQIAQNKASRLLVSLAEEKEESGTYYARFRIASDERDEAIKERDEAREELEDWRNAAKGAENPHPDEKHCTCVPLLHKMLKDARQEAFAIATDQLVQVQMENRKLRETKP